MIADSVPRKLGSWGIEETFVVNYLGNQFLWIHIERSHLSLPLRKKLTSMIK
jgi:hypothetical protein